MMMLTLVGSPVAGAPPKDPPLKVSKGAPAFWFGARLVGPASVLDSGGAGCSKERCRTYTLVVAERADQLRVAIDVPMRDQSFELSVKPPQGQARRIVNSNSYNAELAFADVRPGTYEVTVRARQGTDSLFRMRAALLDDRKEPKSKALLLPNLKAIPPFEFGFVAPANPLNGLYPSDDVNPPLAVGPVAPVSCAADETAEGGAVRCLRFSTGPANAGRGPFVVELEGGGGASARSGDAFQVIERGDGSTTRRPAGTWEYHYTHGHNHYSEILTYLLFEVVDAKTGRLKLSNPGVKSGFCPADQSFADWRSFDQEPQFSSSGNCSSRLGLSTGWGDVYRWQRPGQYVEFSDHGDGLYLVQSIVDLNGWVKESDETDNVAYALIEVAGDEVTIVERGQGRSPWDEDKREFGLTWFTHR